MLESTPNQPNSNPYKFDPVQEELQWMQQQLTEQGIYVSPEEADKLFMQKLIYDTRRWLQQDLAKQGIDVSPDEARAVHRLQFLHGLMKDTGTTNPHDAIELTLSDDSPKPY
jgi:hypothetical protein